MFFNEKKDYHRVKGPAILSFGISINYEKWFFNGNFHRVGNFAYRYVDDKNWYIHGVRQTLKERQWHIV